MGYAPAVPRAVRPLLAAAALLAGAAGRADGPAPGPWRPPPMFAAIWLQGGAFLPSGPEGARPREQVALGLAIRPLPFLSLLAEGGWATRSLSGGRSELTSRGSALGLKLHHRLGTLEPGALAGVSLWRSELAVPTLVGTAGAADSETARSTGLVLGAGLDWLLSDSFALGLDWRWHRARASFPRLGAGRLDLSGHALGLALRLYWP